MSSFDSFVKKRGEERLQCPQCTGPLVFDHVTGKFYCSDRYGCGWDA